METKTFIVPHDFTAVAENALNHAIATAKTLDAQIYVVHVVQKEKNIKEAEVKLAEVLGALDTTVKLIPATHHPREI